MPLVFVCADGVEHGGCEPQGSVMGLSVGGELQLQRDSEHPGCVSTDEELQQGGGDYMRGLSVDRKLHGGSGYLRDQDAVGDQQESGRHILEQYGNCEQDQGGGHKDEVGGKAQQGGEVDHLKGTTEKVTKRKIENKHKNK